MTHPLADMLAIAARRDRDAAEQAATAMDPAEAKAHAEAVLRAYNSLTKWHEFAPGDLVQWKPGMRSHHNLLYGCPTIVTAVEPGRVSSGDVDQDPADVRVLALNENLPLPVCELWIDGRRLMPFVAGPAVQPGTSSGVEQVFDPSC